MHNYLKIGQIDQLDFEKAQGLVPAIIQDEHTGKVLMLGYMNKDAVEQTLRQGKVTFYSRSRQQLWTKGETSGHYLELVSILFDCDQDCLLVKARPTGPTCHTGKDTCFNESNRPDHFLYHLQSLIQERKENPSDASYTSSLFQKGLNKITQKVGEEAIELIIEAKDDDKMLFLGEAADLIYHYLVLLVEKGYELEDVVEVLRQRHTK